MQPEIKLCKRCGEGKPLAAFSCCTSSADRLQRWCKSCISANRFTLAKRVKPPSEKVCNHCERYKPIKAFHRTSNTKDGYAACCYECHKVRYDILGPAGKAKAKARYRRNWKSYAIANAKKRGVECTIVPSDIVIPKNCPVLDIPLNIGAGGMRNPNAPTLDRVNPERGYVPGNVFVISWLANRIKGNQTDPAVFEKIASYIRKHSQ